MQLYIPLSKLQACIKHKDFSRSVCLYHDGPLPTKLFTLVHRSGYRSFSELLSVEGIPLLLFSAGLWDSLSEILRQQHGMVEDNIHIVSNGLVFNEDGVTVDYQRPVIHSYKKGLIPERFVNVKNSIKVILQLAS